MAEISGSGFISMRNQDGTSWYCGAGMWGGRAERRPFGKDEFDSLKLLAPASTRRNSPDNGFYGLMNLKWHPCSLEDAIGAEVAASVLEHCEETPGWCVKGRSDEVSRYFETMKAVDEYIATKGPAALVFEIKSFDEAVIAEWRIDMSEPEVRAAQ